MANLTERIRERVDALQALQIARQFCEYAELHDDPAVRRLVKEFLECEVGLQEIIDGKVSYVP